MVQINQHNGSNYIDVDVMKIAWGPLISNSHSGVDGAGQSNVVEREQDLYVCIFMIIIPHICQF